MPNTSASQNPNRAAQPGVGGKTRPNNGTASPPFYAYLEKEGPGNATAQYQTITAQYAYQSYSLEELRVADYLQNRRFSSPQGNKHAFTAGTAPSGATSSPWFYAPATESLSHHAHLFEQLWVELQRQHLQVLYMDTRTDTSVPRCRHRWRNHRENALAARWCAHIQGRRRNGECEKHTEFSVHGAVFHSRRTRLRFW
jgi:hypothetical protein